MKYGKNYLSEQFNGFHMTELEAALIRDLLQHERIITRVKPGPNPRCPYFQTDENGPLFNRPINGQTIASLRRKGMLTKTKEGTFLLTKVGTETAKELIRIKS
jgi:hypothetical protein